MCGSAVQGQQLEALRAHDTVYGLLQVISKRDILRLEVQQRNVHRIKELIATRSTKNALEKPLRFVPACGLDGLTRGSTLAVISFGRVIVRVVAGIIVVLRFELHVIQHHTKDVRAHVKQLLFGPAHDRA